MAVAEDAVWSAESTTPDEIEAALRRLLVEAHVHDDQVVPARVLNMIAFVDRAWTGEIANRLRGVGRYHASRMLVLSYEPRRRTLDARVTISTDCSSTPGELSLLRETVVVELGEVHLDDLLTIADPLVVTDLPTLLWSPHGHREVIYELLPLLAGGAARLGRGAGPGGGPAVGAATWASRRTSWTSRGCAARRGASAWRRSSTRRPGARNCARSPPSRSATTPPRPPPRCCSPAGWRRAWAGSEATLLAHDGTLRGRAHANRQDVALHLQAAPELMVPGLESVSIETANGRSLRLSRGPGGLRAHAREPHEKSREWTLPGASRGESGVLGEGIRQALLRDPSYGAALDAALAMAG